MAQVVEALSSKPKILNPKPHTARTFFLCTYFQKRILIILIIQEVEIGRMAVPYQPGQKVPETSSPQRSQAWCICLSPQLLQEA
jgi:hypothetical protein